MLTRWKNDWGFGDLDRTLAEFDVLRREMNRLFDARSSAELRGGSGVAPRVGLFDRGSELVVRAELPGVETKDVEITVDQGMLTLRGVRNIQVPEGYSVHRRERGSLKFARSFTLPCRVDSERTTAHLKHGVLTLVLPKLPEDQPRQITVRAK